MFKVTKTFCIHFIRKSFTFTSKYLFISQVIPCVILPNTTHSNSAPMNLALVSIIRIQVMFYLHPQYHIYIVQLHLKLTILLSAWNIAWLSVWDGVSFGQLVRSKMESRWYGRWRKRTYVPRIPVNRKLFYRLQKSSDQPKMVSGEPKV